VWRSDPATAACVDQQIQSGPFLDDLAAQVRHLGKPGEVGHNEVQMQGFGTGLDPQ
jgi:hypothetical protein